MSRADLSYAYAQARLQSRFGERPHTSDWQHLEATRDVGAVLQVVRAGRLARWTARITSRPGVHELERRLREEWMRAVDEVASWQPEQWREGTRWMRWITYLPSLQKLARGGRAPAWMRADPVLGPIVAREPRERAPALADTPLEMGEARRIRMAPQEQTVGESDVGVSGVLDAGRPLLPSEDAVDPAH
mgnify:CR=1 FL=1